MKRGKHQYNNARISLQLQNTPTDSYGKECSNIYLLNPQCQQHSEVTHSKRTSTHANRVEKHV